MVYHTSLPVPRSNSPTPNISLPGHLRPGNPPFFPTRSRKGKKGKEKENIPRLNQIKIRDIHCLPEDRSAGCRTQDVNAGSIMSLRPQPNPTPWLGWGRADTIHSLEGRFPTCFPFPFLKSDTSSAPERERSHHDAISSTLGLIAGIRVPRYIVYDQEPGGRDEQLHRPCCYVGIRSNKWSEMLGSPKPTNTRHPTPDDALRNACTVSADDANCSRFLPRRRVSGAIRCHCPPEGWRRWKDCHCGCPRLRLHRTTLQSGRKEVGPRVVHEAETGATHAAIWVGFMRRRAVADRT